jgi:hypothetical protein
MTSHLIREPLRMNGLKERAAGGIGEYRRENRASHGKREKPRPVIVSKAQSLGKEEMAVCLQAIWDEWP